MKPLRGFCFVFLICLLAAGLLRVPRNAMAAGQVITPVPAETPQDGGTIRANVGLVNLFVTVRNKQHQVITDLIQSDFKIYEDGVEQQVAFFSKEADLPITLAVLMDTSGSETDMLPAIQDNAEQFLKRVLRKGDLAMVLNFDVDINLDADLTDDQEVLDRAISRQTINAPSGTGPFSATLSGGTHFYDAIYLACHDKLSEEAGRKAVVAITDAMDEGSQLKYQDAIESAQRTDTVVHVLLVYDPMYGNAYEVAKKITDETGGRTIAVRGTHNIDQAFDELSEELRSQYTVGYYPTNTKRDGTYRKIKVEIQQPDMSALTRRGYYAPQD
jgi:VWFA-related protein